MVYSIVIPCYKYVSGAFDCVESITKYSDPSLYELVVVFNGSPEEAYQRFKTQYPQFKSLYFPQPIGYPRACNEGVKLTSGENIILLNDDTVLLPQPPNTWFEMLMAPIREDKTVAITGPLKIWRFGVVPNPFIVFFCVLITRECWNAVGGLDEWYTPGWGEDIEFCCAAQERGYKNVQVPERLQFNSKGSFPIYHKGATTFIHILDEPLMSRNNRRLWERYSDQSRYGNNFERAVVGSRFQPPPLENARYCWAAREIFSQFKDSGRTEISVRELGSGSGYGKAVLEKELRLLNAPFKLNYHGYDLSKEAVDFSIKEYGEYYTQADVREVLQKFRAERFYCDTIIAFEFLEHLDDGTKVAKSIRDIAKLCLITTPYDEIPGFWGPHHKMHHLVPSDFPDYTFTYLHSDGSINDEVPSVNVKLSLMLGKSLNLPVRVEDRHVLAYVCTKNRYGTTLPLALSSVLSQDLKPSQFILYDDSESPQDLRQNSLYSRLFQLFDRKGIPWKVLLSNGSGQVFNHQRAYNEGKHIVWRLDDDEVAEPNVLSYYVECLEDPLNGAVSGQVLDPKNVVLPVPSYADNSLESIFSNVNAQWFKLSKELHVEHLYSTFAYKKSAASAYDVALSRVGHREETIFSHQILRNGYKLLLTPNATTWHLRSESGGIRDCSDHTLWQQDERVFMEKLKSWGVHPMSFEWVILDNGLGDHIAFLDTFEELYRIYDKIILASCYPSVFESYSVWNASIAEAKYLLGDLSSHSVYKKMWDWNWGKSVQLAYDRLYDVQAAHLFQENINSSLETIVISPYSKNFGDKQNPKNYPYFKELVSLLRSIYPRHTIVQVGIEGEELIGADEVRFNLSLTELKSLIQRCGFWISVDNFFHHLAHEVGRRGVVLFSKSDPEIFGYSENLNILKSRDFLRQKQFDTWPSEPFDAESFLPPERVADLIRLSF